MSSRPTAMERPTFLPDTRPMQHTSPSPSDRTTLVLGATGKTGRRVTERLRSAGVPVRADQGFPGEVADHIAEVIALARDGRNAVVTDDVERVLGRPARDFADHAHRAAAAGALPVTPAV